MGIEIPGVNFILLFSSSDKLPTHGIWQKNSHSISPTFCQLHLPNLWPKNDLKFAKSVRRLPVAIRQKRRRFFEQKIRAKIHRRIEFGAKTASHSQLLSFNLCASGVALTIFYLYCVYSISSWDRPQKYIFVRINIDKHWSHNQTRANKRLRIATTCQ
jgi:hypothetical protein